MRNKTHPLNELIDILNSDFSNLSDQEIEEDLDIIQPDGSRSCANFELSGQGFHICYDPEAGEIDPAHHINY